MSRGVKLLHREISELVHKPIDGIQVLPDEADLFALTAIVIGPGIKSHPLLTCVSIDGSPFKGGKFTLRLLFTEEYPQLPPKGHFITSIFHPNVSPTTGEICLNTLQKDWKLDLGLAHLLLTIKSLLMTPNPESALNEDAGKMLLEDYDEFCKRASLLAGIHAAATENTMSQENREETTKADVMTNTKKTNPSSTLLSENTRKRLRR